MLRCSSGLWWKAPQESEGRRAPSSGPSHLQGLEFFKIWFWGLCFKWKKALYTQEIWREKWKTSVLMGLRSIPVRKKTPQSAHALDFVSINLLFRGKHKFFGRQLLWPFCSWNCLSNSKGFITLTAGAIFWQRGEEIWESRVLFSFLLITVCWVTSLWPLHKLKYGRTRMLLFKSSVTTSPRQHVTTSPRVHACVLWHVWAEARSAEAQPCLKARLGPLSHPGISGSISSATEKGDQCTCA